MKFPPERRVGVLYMLIRPFLLRQCPLTQEQITLVLPLATIIANLRFSQREPIKTCIKVSTETLNKKTKKRVKKHVQPQMETSECSSLGKTVGKAHAAVVIR